MGDETITTETETTTPEATTPAANVKTFTQDEVNRLVGKARKEGEQRAQKKEQPITPVVDDDEADRPTLKGLKAELAETKARAAFDKRAAKLGLSDEVAEDLFVLSQVQKPADLSSWMETKAKLFAGAPVSTPATPATTDPVKQPAAAPVAPSTPVNPVTSGGLVNLFAMTDAQISQMSVSEIRGHFDKILEHARSQSGAPPRPSPPQSRK